MINKIQDERLRNLAQTLRASGLAASDSEAIRMAESMTKTESKISTKTTPEPVKREVPTPQPAPVVRETQMQQVTQEPELDEEIPGSVENLSQNIISSTDEDISHLTVEQAAGIEETKETPEPTPTFEEEFDEDQPEETVEIKTESKPPKRDLSEFKEAQVDLGSVFRFKG